MNKYIVKEQDGYWYYDVDQEDYEGPFETYSEAEIAYIAHCKWSTRDQRNSIKKMKLWDEM